MKKALNQIRDYAEVAIFVSGLILSLKYGLLALMGAISVILVIESIIIRR